MSDQKPVFTKGYDLRGNTLPRQLGHWIKMKTRIMGNYDTGPGLICLVRLWFLHVFGKPLFAVKIWLKNQHELKHQVRSGLSQIKSRIRPAAKPEEAE